MAATIITPKSTSFTPKKGLVLPPLPFEASPNQSERTHGIIPYLAVVHRPVSNGNFEAALRTLTNPSADVSAHILTNTHKAIQLVEWHRKSWTCASFNSVSYNFEIDDEAWTGPEWDGFYLAAHIVAFVCHKTRIPPTWSRNPHTTAGIIRHLDLGAAGGGHQDPTTNLTVWRNFVEQARYDVNHTGWRKTWGKDKFVPIKGV